MKSWKPWFATRVRKSKMSDFQKLAQAQYEAQFTPLRNYANPDLMTASERQLQRVASMNRLIGW